MVEYVAFNFPIFASNFVKIFGYILEQYAAFSFSKFISNFVKSLASWNNTYYAGAVEPGAKGAHLRIQYLEPIL